MNNLNFTQKLWDNVLNQTMQNMVDGKCSMYRNVYVPMQVRKGNYNKLSSKDKVTFLMGIRNKYWDKDGVHIGDNSNPYEDE
jgi:hypothetical protein